MSQTVIVSNRLASNRLASNRLASNRLASNRLASNRLAKQGVQVYERESNRFLQGMPMDHRAERSSAWRWWYLLFLIQFVAVLWPPFYNRLEPTFVGIPFFYWYQLAWVIIGAILTAIVYFMTED